ncbi:MAG: phospholipase [Enterobacteriaceae bacterium]|jgi:hypothetical protein|nr:phospholipase [Enterobacteriaceae bacterium]
MILAITSFLNQLGLSYLPVNQSTTKSPSTGNLHENKNKLTSSETISLSDNTKITNSLSQQLLNEIQTRMTATPELKANDIAGRNSKYMDENLVKVTDHVYCKKDNSVDIGNQVRLSNDEIAKAGIDPAILNDRSSGFQAGVYWNNGLYIVSFRGSDEYKDYMASVRQGLGYRETQYEQAIDLAYKSLKAFGENIIFTGHSLGGGLATMAALATGKPAVLFNSAGVSQTTLERQGWKANIAEEMADAGLIRNYVVEHDWLDTLQKNLPIPQVMGNQILLKNQYVPQSGNIVDSIFHYSYVTHSLDAHGLPKTLELLGTQRPWLDQEKVNAQQVQKFYLA